MRYTSSTSRPSFLTRRELSGCCSLNPQRSSIVTPTWRLLALAVRMSWPAGGVLVVTLGSNDGSKNIGSRRASSSSSVSPRFNRNDAPAAWAARAAAANASRVHRNTNLHDGRFIDTLDEVLPICGGRCRDGCRSRRVHRDTLAQVERHACAVLGDLHSPLLLGRDPCGERLQRDRFTVDEVGDCRGARES